MASLVLSSASGDAKLKLTEAALTDRFACEEVDRSGLMPQPAFASYFFF